MSLKRRPPADNVRRVAPIGDNLRGTLTNKAGRVVQFESFLERTLLLRLDRDRTVRDYSSQPEIFRYRDGEGRLHTYTPDFRVWRQDETVEIHEVMLTNCRARPAIYLRETAAQEICQGRGWRYVVHTEQDLPRGSELANLLALFRYRPTAYADACVIQAALARLKDGQRAYIGQVIGHLADELDLPETSIIPALCHMLWHGQLMTDLHNPIFVGGAPFPHLQVWIDPEER